jgi:Flp pilus assembly protein TadG
MRTDTGFWKDTTGNIGILAALALIPILLVTGAAIDFGRANYARTVLQGAVDAAALAGGASKDKSPARLQTIVEQYVMANHAQQVLQYVSKISQSIDSNAGTFNVEVDGKLPTSFMAIAGIKTMDIGARSQVNLGAQALEIAMVLDNTGSMAGTKIANLKTAANNLVNIVEKEAASYSDTKFAVVPFAEYVNVGAGFGLASWLDKSGIGSATWNGCVGSRPQPFDLTLGNASKLYPAVAGVPCNTQLLPLTADLAAVRSRINLMTATGSTYIPTGLLWGWNVLDSVAPFTEGRTKAQMKTLKGRKALILMTDGENTISPTYPAHDGIDTAASNDNLASICKNVKKDDIEVFTVSFMVPSPMIKGILEDCATSPANYFDADNSTELYSAFTDIARELAAVRLTQ